MRYPHGRRRFNTALWVGTGTSLACATAMAQSLDEVVVTATRRDTTLQDIPYSISAVSADSLEQSHVESVADLSRVIAGMTFVDTGPTSRSNIVLRGINANSTAQQGTSTNGRLNTVSPVSTYIGETPLYLPLQIDDIERVEVLKGPQGTLYGSGSLAGTLRFIPKAPDLSGWHGGISGDFAGMSATSQTNRALAGALNIPLTGSAGMRVSAGYSHYGGFINEPYIVKLGAPGSAINSPVGIPVPADPNNPNFSGLVFQPEKDTNVADLWHVRVSLLLKPNDAFSALLAYYHQDDRTRGVQADSPDFSGNVDAPPSQNPFYSAAYPVSYPTGGSIFPHNAPFDANDSFLPREHRKSDLASADLTYSLGFASLSASTSYYKDAGDSVNDNTGVLTLFPSVYGFMPRMLDYQTTSDSQKGFVEEVRLVSNTHGPLDYVVGVFYQHITTTFNQMQWVPGQTYFASFYDTYHGYGPDSPGYIPPDPAGLGDVNTIGHNTSTFNDRAAFGELTWHLTKRWQVTGGMRRFRQGFATSDSTAFPFCGGFTAACSSFSPPDPLGTTFVQRGYSVGNQIFKLNTSYTVSKDLNLYFNYAEGFRRGGSNGIPVSGVFRGNPALLIYKPDKTRNFEVGAKGALGPVHYSADAFYIDWDDFQVDSVAIASTFPIGING